MLLRGTIYSNALEMDTNITIFAPNDLPDSVPYKVAILLHGLGGGHSDWTDCSRLASYAAELPLYIIMPEVARSFYCNMKYGPQYFTYIAEELPELAKRFFNISARREDTGIMGASMGGFGALKSALTYPERFGFCCVFSAASLFFSKRTAGMKLEAGRKAALEKYGPQIFRDFQGILGLELEPGEENEITFLAGKTAASGALPRLYSACGMEDPFLSDNRRFAEIMRRLGYDFTYEEWRGEHDWDFFDPALKKGLDFIFKG